MESLPDPLVCLTVGHNIDDIGAINGYLADPALAQRVMRCIPIILHEMFGVWPSTRDTLNYLKIIWSTKRNALSVAAALGLTSAVSYLTENKGQKSVYQQQDFDLALTLASRGGHIETMRKLFSLGVSLDSETIYETISNKQIDALRLLLTDSRSKNKMHRYLTGAYDQDIITVAAVRTGDVEILKLLVEHGLDVAHAEEDIPWAAGVRDNTPMIDYLRTFVEIKRSELFINAVADGTVEDIDRLMTEDKKWANTLCNIGDADCSAIVNTALERGSSDGVYHIMLCGICAVEDQRVKLAAAIGDADYLNNFLSRYFDKHDRGSESMKKSFSSFLMSIGITFGQARIVELAYNYAGGFTAQEFDIHLRTAIASNHVALVNHMLNYKRQQLTRGSITEVAEMGHAEVLALLIPAYRHDEKTLSYGKHHDGLTLFLDGMLYGVLNRMLYGIVYIPQNTASRHDLLVTIAVLVLFGANPTPLYDALDDVGDIARLIKIIQHSVWLDQYVENELAMMSKRRKPISHGKVPQPSQCQ